MKVRATDSTLSSFVFPTWDAEVAQQPAKTLYSMCLIIMMKLVNLAHMLSLTSLIALVNLISLSDVEKAKPPAVLTVWTCSTGSINTSSSWTPTHDNFL